MTRRRSIVGIGEASLAEYPDREEPAGLALRIPMIAALLGHEGIAISRLGQDRTGDALVARLAALDIDVTHLQRDPDLATGRLQVRATGEVRVDTQVAFDNLQWDSDLSDVAQMADVVVFGLRARRSGQTRSTIDRFLEECALAVRLCDLTARDGEKLERGIAVSGLRLSEAAVVDASGLAEFVPSASGAAPRDAALELIRQGELKFLLIVEEGRPFAVHTVASSWTGEHPFERRSHEAVIVALLHGVLAGWDMRDALDLAERVARHATDHPGEPAPEQLLDRAAR